MQRSLRFGRLSAVATALGVVSVYVATSSSPVALASEPVPPLFAGSTPAGTVIEDIDVYAMPSDDVLRDAPIGALIPAIKVDDVAVLARGNSFAITMSPDRMPAGVLDSNGNAFLSITTYTDKGAYKTSASVRAVAGKQGTALWADPELVDPTAGSTRGEMVGASKVTLSSSDLSQSTTVRLADLQKLPDEAVRKVLAAGEPNPPAGCAYEKLNERIRPTTIGTTYPVGLDTAIMTVSSSTGASYGVAASFKTGGSWGAFGQSTTKHTQSGWGFQWASYNEGRSYQKGILYGKYLTHCVRGCDGCERQWIPIGETGGTGENRGIARPNWGNCQLVSAGSWWRDNSGGTAYKYDAGVKFAGVIGVDLSVNRQYNSSQKLQYNLTKKRRMCGSNTWPATAGKVMSRTKN